MADFFDHGVDGGEPLLRADEGDEVGFDDLAIDVFIEVEQPDLEAGRDLAGGGIDADVGDAGQLAAVG